MTKISVLLLMVLLFLINGCAYTGSDRTGVSDAQGTVTITIPADETIARYEQETSAVDSTVPLTPAEDEWVTELVNARDDRYGQTNEGEMWYLQYSLRLPEVHVSAEIDQTVHDQIQTEFYLPAMKRIEEKRAAFKVNYRAFVNGDILSLLVVEHNGFGTGGYTVYTANIDKLKNCLLTFEELSARLGYDPDSVIAALECPKKELFYLNEMSELIIFDYRQESQAMPGRVYYACQIATGSEAYVADVMTSD